MAISAAGDDGETKCRDGNYGSWLQLHARRETLNRAWMPEWHRLNDPLLRDNSTNVADDCRCETSIRRQRLQPYDYSVVKDLGHFLFWISLIVIITGDFLWEGKNGEDQE